MKKDDTYRLDSIKRTGAALMDYLESSGLTEDQLLNDSVAQWTVTTPLYNIGEQVNHISNELMAAHPEIPWLRIAGMRHRLVHDYEETNWSIVAHMLFEDIPMFLEQVVHMTLELENHGPVPFDAGELALIEAIDADAIPDDEIFES